MLKKSFLALKQFMFNSYGTKEGTMLIHLGALGWILSSTAQTIAILTNKSISKKEKKYLVPQELSDGVINVACYYGITKVFQDVVTKMIDSGKILVTSEKGYTTKASLFKSPLCILAVLTGSVLSCNLITPLLRNTFATLIHKSKNNKNVNPNYPNIKYYSLYKLYGNQFNNINYINNQNGRLFNVYSSKGMKL